MMTTSARPRILCRTGPLAGITREIDLATTLGRGSGNDCVVNSPLVSTRHARIFREEQDYFLEDLGSSNGTRLDGMEVRGRVRLERLHVITLAESVDFIFSRPESASAQASDDNPADAPVRGTRAGRGTEVVESGDWGDLPDLSSPAAPAAPPPRPAAPAAPSPPGRGTEMVESGDWGDLPDLGSSDEPVPGEISFEQHPQGVHTDDPAGPPVAESSEGAEGAEGAEEVRAPEPAPIPELVVALPGGPLQTFALKVGDNTIGRSEECDIRIVDPDKQVSRDHAVLRVSPGGITLIDSGSANGSYVGGERVQTATLSTGKSFRLGPHLECTLLQR